MPAARQVSEGFAGFLHFGWLEPLTFMGPLSKFSPTLRFSYFYRCWLIEMAAPVLELLAAQPVPARRDPPWRCAHRAGLFGRLLWGLCPGIVRSITCPLPTGHQRGQCETLPITERDCSGRSMIIKWRLAVQVLIDASEHHSPMLFARTASSSNSGW